MTRHRGGRFLPPNDLYIGPTEVARRLKVTKKAVRDMLEDEVLPCIKDDYGNHWCEIVVVDAFAQRRAEEALKKREEALARKAKELERKAKALEAKARRLAATLPVAAAGPEDLYDMPYDPGIASLPDTRDEQIPPIPAFPPPTPHKAHDAARPVRPTDSVRPSQKEAPSCPSSADRRADHRGGEARPERSHRQAPALDAVLSAVRHGVWRTEHGRSDVRSHPLLAPVPEPPPGQRLPPEFRAPSVDTETTAAESFRGWTRREDGSFETLEDRERDRQRGREWEREGQREQAERAGPGLAKALPAEGPESDSDVADEPPPSRRTG